MHATINNQGGANSKQGAKQANPEAGKSENVTDIDYNEVKQ